MLVDQLDAENADLGVLRPVEEGERLRQRVPEQRGIGIEEEDVVGGRAARADVAGRGETGIEPHLDEGERQVEGADAFERAVGRAVVDDDHPGQHEAGAVGADDRLQADPELIARVPVDDDDVDGRQRHRRRIGRGARVVERGRGDRGHVPDILPGSGRVSA